LSTSGKGFSAFVTKGIPREVRGTDEKPEISSWSDYTQISMPTNNQNGGTAGQDFAFGFFQSKNAFIDMTEGERVTQVDVENKPSPSGMYDCFFHFHNDISHTWLNNENIGNAHNSYDQYIRMDVNPV